MNILNRNLSAVEELEAMHINNAVPSYRPSYVPSYYNVYPVRITSLSSRETCGETEAKLRPQLRP